MLALTLIGMSMTACVQANFDSRVCPREASYTKAQQTQLADELKVAGPMTRQAIRDYGKLRDKARACRGEG